MSHCIRWGSKVNVIAAMSQDRVVVLELASGSVSGAILFDFVSSSLIPVMMPFSGVNSQSVLITRL